MLSVYYYQINIIPLIIWTNKKPLYTKQKNLHYFFHYFFFFSKIMDKDFSPYKTQLDDKSRLIQQQGLQALSNDLETYKSTFIFIKLISIFIRTISIDRTEYMKCISNLFNLLKTTNEQQSLSLIESISLCFIITLSSSQAAKYRKYRQQTCFTLNDYYFLV